MPQVRRTGPYIWSTWLTRLLTGEASCEWASQFKARHESGSWEKAPSDFDQDQWMLRHTAPLNNERVVWERGDHVVTTESQNHFTLRGNAAVVAGKPDLIAVWCDITARDCSERMEWEHRVRERTTDDF